jgi:hypothetical protein
VLPSAPWFPVAPCGPAGPGTATGVAGTMMVGLSQAVIPRVTSSAETIKTLFIFNPYQFKTCVNSTMPFTLSQK